MFKFEQTYSDRTIPNNTGFKWRLTYLDRLLNGDWGHGHYEVMS